MTCIAALPEDYRIVVEKLYLNQNSLSDVATQMERSEDAVRRLGGRALERLAECMGRASRYLSTG
jgi:DNA-directed RNA polymerase specialized sigma24 family protein